MCKQSSYSKYQKRVIKFLNDLLGTETPFTYERTQTNHLKVLIDGVPKPIFTGSTPSDNKSINNFMAEVKRELKASNTESVEPEVSMLMLPTPLKLTNDKLIQGCIKSLRTRCDVIKSQEEALVIEQQCVDGINASRMKAVKHAFSHAMQARKQSSYIKPKEMKGLESTVLKHLDFMLPSLAYYSELLGTKKKYQVASTDPLPAESVMTAEDVAEFRETNVVKMTEVKEQTKETANNMNGQVMNTKSDVNNSATELMSLSTNNRVSLLRGLSKAEALMLIDDVNQALALNREKDIDAVVGLIRDKDLPMEAIISRLEAA